MKEKKEIIKLITEYQWNKDEISKNKILEAFLDLRLLKDIQEQIRNAIGKDLPIPKITNIYSLIASENLMMISHYLILKNKNEDKFSVDKIKTLSKVIIKKTFEWDSIKKTLLKTEKKSFRFMRILNYSEKIINSNILFILETIFEPMFKEHNSNMYAESDKDCKTVISRIVNYTNLGLNWVIKADVKKVFGRFHLSTLIRILTKYIDDKDFINLIYKACLIFTIKTFEDNKFSFFLSNLYKYYFDKNIKRILEEIKIQIKTEKSQFLKTETKSLLILKKYKEIVVQIKDVKYRVEEIESKKLFRTLYDYEKKEIRELKKFFYLLKKQRSKFNRLDCTKVSLQYYYNRLAGKFIILINLNYKICVLIKEKIVNFLKNILHSNLTLEKAKIINLKNDKLYFLGYAIFMSKERFTKTVDNNSLMKIERRIFVGIDKDKVYKRLIINQFALEKSLKPRECPYLIPLEPQDILMYYNAKILSVYNYYYGLIKYKSQLNRIWYILYFSALKTLATKYRLTTKKIYEQFGWREMNNLLKFTNRIRIVVKYSKTLVESFTHQKFVMLHNLKDVQYISKLVNSNKNSSIRKFCYLECKNFKDIWKKYKINWRKSFEINDSCIKCGFSRRFQLCYIKQLSKLCVRKDETFLINIIKNLNKKWLILCQECFNNLYTRNYNGNLLKYVYNYGSNPIKHPLKIRKIDFGFNQEIFDCIDYIGYEKERTRFLLLQRIVISQN